jgi:hypothetical protein
MGSTARKAGAENEEAKGQHEHRGNQGKKEEEKEGTAVPHA